MLCRGTRKDGTALTTVQVNEVKLIVDVTADCASRINAGSGSVFLGLEKGSARISILCTKEDLNGRERNTANGVMT